MSATGAQANVERDPRTGKVVAVWLGCIALSFTDDVADVRRADDMREAYKGNDGARLAWDSLKPIWPTKKEEK